MRRTWLYVLLLVAVSGVCLGGGEPEAEKEKKRPRDPVEAIRSARKRVKKVGPHRYRLGKLVIDAARRTVRCRGKINMARGGPIELLACLPTGKVHESVLTVDVNPLDLQVALLLLDLDPGRNPGVEYAEDEPEGKRRLGDTVRLFVEWREPVGGKGDAKKEGKKRTVRHRAENLLWDVRAKDVLKPTEWVFVGSRWVKGRFGADLEGSLVTTYYDPFAILELPGEKVRDDTWCEVNTKLCPPVGTEVELVIEAPKREEGEGEKKGEGGER